VLSRPAANLRGGYSGSAEMMLISKKEKAGEAPAVKTQILTGLVIPKGLR
jgi:hypothetical protein